MVWFETVSDLDGDTSMREVFFSATLSTKSLSTQSQSLGCQAAVQVHTRFLATRFASYPGAWSDGGYLVTCKQETGSDRNHYRPRDFDHAPGPEFQPHFAIEGFSLQDLGASLLGDLKPKSAEYRTLKSCKNTRCSPHDGDGRRLSGGRDPRSLAPGGRGGGQLLRLLPRAAHRPCGPVHCRGQPQELFLYPR